MNVVIQFENLPALTFPQAAEYLGVSLQELDHVLATNPWIRPVHFAFSTDKRIPKLHLDTYKEHGKNVAGYVYFVSDGESIKIGHALNPTQRITSLQTGASRPLKVLLLMEGGPDFERTLHLRFHRLRKQGEWFTPGPKLVKFIQENGGAIE